MNKTNKKGVYPPTLFEGWWVNGFCARGDVVSDWCVTSARKSSPSEALRVIWPGPDGAKRAKLRNIMRRFARIAPSGLGFMPRIASLELPSHEDETHQATVRSSCARKPFTLQPSRRVVE